MQIELPIARRDGRPLTGRVVVEMVANWPRKSMPFAWGRSRGYPAVPSKLAAAQLTVRKTQAGQRQKFDRKSWRLARSDGNKIVPSRHHLFLPDGFQPGWIYELSYIASDARIVCLGLASLRDAAAFFRDKKHPLNPLGDSIGRVIGFGHSQSARVLQHMLYQAFHLDKANHSVFDALFMNAPGGGKGSFNHRFAQTTRHPSQHEDHQYPADFFPFATVPQTDPVTGRKGDLLAAVRKAPKPPKLIYTQSSTDYWTRSASLLHSDVTGQRDLPLDPLARLYVYTGAQHFIYVPRHRGRFAFCHNPADYRVGLRALLLRLDDWMSGRQDPPPSKRPTLATQTLGSLGDYRKRLGKIPVSGGFLQAPNSQLRPPRLDHGRGFANSGIMTKQPPNFGPRFETLLPIPDADGNDLGGIRLPGIQAPLGTFLGWNHRQDGAHGAIGRWSGSYIPFAANTKTARKGGDNRTPLDSRYRDRNDYLSKVKKAARELVSQGYLLEQDIAGILSKANRRYQAQIARDPSDKSCNYLR